MVNMKKSRRFKIMVHCPEWTDEGFSVKVNGKEYIRVSFRAADGVIAAKVFDVRILKP